jgi:hypothetical protein
VTQELIYTSAPRGLRSGVKGFCTVASTAGMAVTLADRLESLSGYRHLYPPHDERASKNPVNYSHLKITVGGQSFDVLSRVCDAGIDYSQRSNKLAHHVAIVATERPACGPARLLAEPGFMETSWQGEPRILPSGRKPPVLTETPRICTAWQKATGDAGWAGVLAATAGQRDPKPVHLIIPAGLDALPLVAESLALVSPELRWEVTFSTFFTRLPPGVDCQWRFVVDGQPEAETARRSPHWLVYDLCKPMPPAADGPLVTAALTGKLPPVETVRPHRATMFVHDLTDVAELPPPEALPTARDRTATSPHKTHGSEARAASPPLIPTRPRRGVPKPVLYVTAVMCVTLVLASVACVAYLLGSRSHHEISITHVEENASPVPPPSVERHQPKTTEPMQEPPQVGTPEVASASKPDGPVVPPAEASIPPVGSDNSPMTPTAPSPTPSPSPTATIPEPPKFKFLEGSTKRVELPLDGSTDPIVLVRWENDHGAQPMVNFKESKTPLAPEISGANNEWKITRKYVLSPFAQVYRGEGDNSLTLAFNTHNAEDQSQLVGRDLEVSIGGENCTVTFDFPHHQSTIKFAIKDFQTKSPKKFDPGWTYLPNGFRLKQTLEPIASDLTFEPGEGTKHVGHLKGFRVELRFSLTEKPEGANLASLAIKPEELNILLPHKNGSGPQPLSKERVEGAIKYMSSERDKFTGEKKTIEEAQPNAPLSPKQNEAVKALWVKIVEATEAVDKLKELSKWLEKYGGDSIVLLEGQIKRN